MKKRSYFGAYGIIIKKDKIVLITKSRGAYKGKLDLPGGGIEHTETPRDALKREIMEEAGLEVIKNELLDTTSFNTIWYNVKEQDNEDFHHVGILFLVQAKGRVKRVPDGIDSNGSSWYKVKDLKKENLTPFAKYSLEKLGYKLIDR